MGKNRVTRCRKSLKNAGEDECANTSKNLVPKCEKSQGKMSAQI